MAPSAWANGGRGVTIHWSVVLTSLGPMLVAATEKGVCRLSFNESEIGYTTPREQLRLEGKLTGQITPKHTLVGTILDLQDDISNRCLGGGGCWEQRALATAGDGTAGIHVSFDLDVCDPSIAPGVGTPVKGGLAYREAHLAMEIVSDSGRLLGLDLVEVNPVLDIQNQTATLAVELALSAMGLRIL